MLKQFSIAFSLASVVLAQSSSAPAASATSSALTPSGLSTECAKFYADLNQDTALGQCTTSILSAVEAYIPGGSSSNPTSAQLVSSLNNLCTQKSTEACTDSTFQQRLSGFYAACSNELVSSPVQAVRDFYAVLYLIKPFLSALCTKNDNGDYCVIKSKLPGSSSATPSGLSNNIANTGPAPLDVQDYLVANPSLTRRAPTAALVPNTTTYAESGLPYFFLSPADSADTLCTPCTRNIMTSYINYQSSVPYAGTLDQSPIFKHQPELYSAISDKCGSSFLGGAVQAAGGLKGGILGNGAPRSLGAESALAFVAVALGATAVTFSVL
ncbi:hypothetical protein ONZ45_g1208 [Pleurotus djamor]|nr:hypothetical protein ONZ45_g1208 [Pleurotus djamor]